MYLTHRFGAPVFFLCVLDAAVCLPSALFPSRGINGVTPINGPSSMHSWKQKIKEVTAVIDGNGARIMIRSPSGGWFFPRRWIPFKRRTSLARSHGLCGLQQFSLARYFTSQKHHDELYKYMKDKLNIEENLHDDLLTSLRMVYGNNIQLENLTALSKEDLHALAASVPEKKQNPKQRPSRMIHIVVPHQNTSFDLQWKFGESLLDLAKRHDALGVHVEGACGGQMACSTCHVYLDKETLHHVPEKNEIEWDMLETAYEPNASSRLGCQIRLDSELMALNSITVTIPAGINNAWED